MSMNLLRGAIVALNEVEPARPVTARYYQRLASYFEVNGHTWCRPQMNILTSRSVLFQQSLTCTDPEQRGKS